MAENHIILGLYIHMYQPYICIYCACVYVCVGYVWCMYSIMYKLRVRIDVVHISNQYTYTYYIWCILTCITGGYNRWSGQCFPRPHSGYAGHKRGHWRLSAGYTALFRKTIRLDRVYIHVYTSRFNSTYVDMYSW